MQYTSVYFCRRNDLNIRNDGLIFSFKRQQNGNTSLKIRPSKPVGRSSFLVKYADNVITHERKTHLRWLSPAMHACFLTVLNPSVRRASGGGPWRSCRQLVPRGIECDFGRWLAALWPEKVLRAVVILSPLAIPSMARLSVYLATLCCTA